MSDLTARLRLTYRDTYVAWLVDPTNCINARCNEAADRIEALEAENAALDFDVAALDELNIALEAECERLRSDRIEALEAALTEITDAYERHARGAGRYSVTEHLPIIRARAALDRNIDQRPKETT